MITHGLYSVFDSKAEVWSPPFIARNSAEATRTFEQAVNDGNTMVCKYPLDYALFEVGSWDCDNGEVISGVPKNLGLGVTFVRKDKQ